ncbi:MAG: response regulator [Hellea sp.]|nr:response regulator [Hellea sp.]
MSLDGHNILVVEDEFLIALDLQDSLEDEGAAVIGPADTVPGALKLLSQEKICAAILDINLGRENSKDVAVKLTAADIPFLYHSGQGALEELSEWPQAPVLTKPSSPDVLITKLTELLNPVR